MGNYEPTRFIYDFLGNPLSWSQSLEVFVHMKFSFASVPGPISVDYNGTDLLTPSASGPHKFNSSKYARHIIKINLERENAYILHQAVVSDIYSASEMYFIPLIEKQ